MLRRTLNYDRTARKGQLGPFTAPYAPDPLVVKNAFMSQSHNLSFEQSVVLEEVKEAVKSRDSSIQTMFALEGAAGTGKTTIIQALLSNIDASVALTPSNVQASFYGRKGLTIHSAFGMTPFNQHHDNQRYKALNGKQLILFDETQQAEKVRNLDRTWIGPGTGDKHVLSSHFHHNRPIGRPSSDISSLSNPP